MISGKCSIYMTKAIQILNMVLLLNDVIINLVYSACYSAKRAIIQYFRVKRDIFLVSQLLKSNTLTFVSLCWLNLHVISNMYYTI